MGLDSKASSSEGSCQLLAKVHCGSVRHVAHLCSIAHLSQLVYPSFLYKVCFFPGAVKETWKQRAVLGNLRLLALEPNDRQSSRQGLSRLSALEASPWPMGAESASANKSAVVPKRSGLESCRKLPATLGGREARVGACSQRELVALFHQWRIWFAQLQLNSIRA